MQRLHLAEIAAIREYDPELSTFIVTNPDKYNDMHHIRRIKAFLIVEPRFNERE